MSESLWSTILRESSKRPKLPMATAICMGSCSKDFLASISSNSTDPKENSRPEILSYNYLEIDEGSADAESLSRVNIWTIGEGCFQKAFDVVVNPNIVERLAFIISLDLTKEEECISSLRAWLYDIKDYEATYLNGLNDETRKLLKESSREFLAAAKSLQGGTLSLTSTSNGGSKSKSHQDDNVDVDSQQSNNNNQEKALSSSADNLPFSLPIIVVACKSDSIRVDDAAAVHQSKDIQGRLRAICLQAGAALIYTSVNKNINCTKLKKYLIHRLFLGTIPMPEPISIEDGIDACFVPSGFDSPELIKIATGVSFDGNDSTLKIDFSTSDRPQLSRATSSSSLANSGVSIAAASGKQAEYVSMESEDEWLASLQSFITQVTAGGTGTTQPLATTASNPLNVSASTSSVTSEGSTKSTTSSRRQVTRAGAGEEKQDVGDFFKSLLAGSNAPTKK